VSTVRIETIVTSSLPFPAMIRILVTGAAGFVEVGIRQFIGAGQYGKPQAGPT
jgi:hypothetical protein